MTGGRAGKVISEGSRDALHLVTRGAKSHLEQKSSPPKHKAEMKEVAASARAESAELEIPNVLEGYGFQESGLRVQRSQRD